MPREAVKSPSLALLTAQPPESQTEVSFEVGSALNEGTGLAEIPRSIETSTSGFACWLFPRHNPVFKREKGCSGLGLLPCCHRPHELRAPRAVTLPPAPKAPRVRVSPSHWDTSGRDGAGEQCSFPRDSGEEATHSQAVDSRSYLTHQP